MFTYIDESEEEVRIPAWVVDLESFRRWAESDGLFLCNVHADIAGNPDGTFASADAIESGRVRLIEGKRGGYVELEGSPDMVLEVVSPSSVRKDPATMRQAYGESEVREYWLVDAREDPLQFDVFRHTSRGYVAARKQDGWLKSAVFGKAFRLTQRMNRLGHAEYTLEVR
jgi:Uma2 family endonuclease